MDLPTAKLVQGIVRRESLSLLSYVGDAFPWTAKLADPALALLRQIVAEHNRAVSTLGRLLARHRMAPPSIGSYPSSFTAINFLALNYILARLIDSERPSLIVLEAETAGVTDPEVRAVIEQFLNVKRGHLARLQALAAPPPASAPTPAAS
jgi:rubrerythrin